MTRLDHLQRASQTNVQATLADSEEWKSSSCAPSSFWVTHHESVASRLHSFTKTDQDSERVTADAATDPPVDLALCPPLTREQDLEISHLVNLWRVSQPTCRGQAAFLLILFPAASLH